MSNVLAISAVTHLLKDMLNNALIDGNISDDLTADFTVTALSPDRVLSENQAEQPTQLNLFLYRISPNTALRNADLPTRRADGTLSRRPVLALDLHYILTAVSAEELHPEILLGYAMQLFHERPILDREQIRASLQLNPMDQILPEAYDTARASAIADQIESIKITPRTLSMDDMSKLWTAFQASYRTTVAYDVCLVMIEREIPTRPALPVLSRGGLIDPVTLRDPGVDVRAGVGPAVPTLTRVEPTDGHPVMRLGGRVALTGFLLDGGPGGQVTVRFTEPGSGVVQAMSPETPAAPNRLVVALPAVTPLAAGNPAEGGVQDPASWRIGPYIVDVEVIEAGGRRRLSNALPLALASASTASVAATPPGVTLTLTAAPPIRPGQSVAVIAGTEMVVLPAPAAPATQVSALFSGLPSGPGLPVRLRVDGIDSPVIDRSVSPPVLTTVTIP
ncbi:DUF4255 domain-containing protein [Salipiger sp. H15]|uniref:DUF4255 domain-containing protein n=1 Tax=Alloyangia sp. H15 TaxID=3029062 RepID=A0AAU8ALU5_9RHOB